MTLSINDQKNKIENYLFNNSFINYIFGNIIIVSILIVISNILILYILEKKDVNIIKMFIWMNINTLIMLILHNKTIKIENRKQYKNKGSEEFKGMMENNTFDLIEKKDNNILINGKNEVIESDIIKFLD